MSVDALMVSFSWLLFMFWRHFVLLFKYLFIIVYLEKMVVRFGCLFWL